MNTQRYNCLCLQLCQCRLFWAALTSGCLALLHSLAALSCCTRRVHTMMLPVLTELSELYRAADGAATACLLAKLGVEKSLMSKLDDTRQALLVRVMQGPVQPARLTRCPQTMALCVERHACTSRGRGPGLSGVVAAAVRCLMPASC